jgi:transketolase
VNIEQIKALAKQIRMDSLQMCHDAKSAHIGSCLSCADVLAVLYGEILRVNPVDPEWPERDRFILSKGHACAALYAVLAERGFFPKARLKNFYKNGSDLIGHANHKVPGVEVSTGSLGDGLSIGCGMALADRKHKVYVLMGDGECNEGQIYEAAMFAANHKLSNLVAIIDYNDLQAMGKTSGISGLEPRFDSLPQIGRMIGFSGFKPLFDRWHSFGWQIRDVDGNNIQEVLDALSGKSKKPTCIIAYTKKGKGVSVFEARTDSHYRHPNDQELEQALRELI